MSTQTATENYLLHWTYVHSVWQVWKLLSIIHSVCDIDVIHASKWFCFIHFFFFFLFIFAQIWLGVCECVCLVYVSQRHFRLNEFVKRWNENNEIPSTETSLLVQRFEYSIFRFYFVSSSLIECSKCHSERWKKTKSKIVKREFHRKTYFFFSSFASISSRLFTSFRFSLYFCSVNVFVDAVGVLLLDQYPVENVHRAQCQWWLRYFIFFSSFSVLFFCFVIYSILSTHYSSFVLFPFLLVSFVSIAFFFSFLFVHNVYVYQWTTPNAANKCQYQKAEKRRRWREK